MLPCEACPWRKSSNENGATSEQIWPLIQMYIHSGLWRRDIAKAEMRKSILYKSVHLPISRFMADSR